MMRVLSHLLAAKSLAQCPCESLALGVEGWITGSTGSCESRPAILRNLFHPVICAERRAKARFRQAIADLPQLVKTVAVDKQMSGSIG